MNKVVFIEHIVFIFWHKESRISKPVSYLYFQVKRWLDKKVKNHANAIEFNLNITKCTGVLFFSITRFQAYASPNWNTIKFFVGFS